MTLLGPMLAVLLAPAWASGPGDPARAERPGAAWPMSTALACFTGDLEPVDSSGLRFRWTVDGVVSPIDGPVLPAGSAPRDASVACVVRSDDPALALDAVRIEPPDPTAGDALRCVAGRFRGAGGRPDSLSWTVAGDPASLGGIARPGVSLGDGGTTCTAGRWDAPWAEVVAAPVRIGDRPPVVASVAIVPERPTSASSLSAVVDVADPDGDPVQVVYRWSVDGVPVDGRTAALDAVVPLRRGAEVAVDVEAFDGTSWSAIATARTRVADAPPTRPVARVEATDRGLRCTVAGASVDADGDEVTLAFSWERNGRPYLGATTTRAAGDTIAARVIAPDEEWSCTITARAGGATVDSVPASTVVIAPQVATGSGHACALRANGLVVCWGNDTLGSASPPAGRFRQLSVGAWHACAISVDRGMSCWGADNYGQSTPIDGTWRQVSAGAWHTCAIDVDRAVRCWGQEADGRTASPPGRFVEVSAGWSHSCALRDDGAVVCWGSDEAGQASPPAGKFTQVSVGESHSCAIAAGGAVTCWGSDDRGVRRPPPGSFVEVEAGALFSCARRASGEVVCWGSDHFGQTEPPAVAFDRLGPGVSGMCGWSDAGQIKCWGRDHQGQATPPPIPPL